MGESPEPVGEAAHRLSCVSLFNRGSTTAGRGGAGSSVDVELEAGTAEPRGTAVGGTRWSRGSGDHPAGVAGKDEIVEKTDLMRGSSGVSGTTEGCRGDGPISFGFKMSAFAGQVLLTCSVALITQASKHGGASYGYNTLTIPFWSEVLKLGLSAAFLLRENVGSERPTFTFRGSNFAAASVPALLYLVTNNFNFIIIHEIGALSFQILNNFKIVTAAIMFQIIMKQQLSSLQWRGVMLLMVGSMLSQLKDCTVEGGFAVTGTTLGYVLKAVNCFLTSLAGVYCEKFLKHSNDSIHYQNLQLYFWGSLFASGSLLVSSVRERSGLEELWRGQNVLSVTLILNYAFVGLATAFVLKYLDNIAKNFAAVAAMFAAAFAAWALFDESLSLHLYIGLGVCTMAGDLYVRHAYLSGATGTS
jgi:UDP-galactose transporter